MHSKQLYHKNCRHLPSLAPSRVGTTRQGFCLRIRPPRRTSCLYAVQDNAITSIQLPPETFSLPLLQPVLPFGVAWTRSFHPSQVRLQQHPSEHPFSPPLPENMTVKSTRRNHSVYSASAVLLLLHRRVVFFWAISILVCGTLLAPADLVRIPTMRLIPSYPLHHSSVLSSH
jgi:hypothetical protein